MTDRTIPTTEESIRETSEDAESLINALGKMELDQLERDPKVRRKAVALSRKLTARLEDPVTRATEIFWSELPAMCARIALDLDLFARIAAHDGPITTRELAATTGGEELLITRILRVLASIDFVRQEFPDTWSATLTTKAAAIPEIASGHHAAYDTLFLSAATAPKFFRETAHRSPASPTHGLLQYAFQTKLTVFDWYEQCRPDLQRHFNKFMGSHHGDRPFWIDWYPVEERIFQGFDPAIGGPLMVDVGGGKGHDLLAFCEKYPGRGKCVLQDLEAALEGVGEERKRVGIECMTHDFFREQPVKDARVYFLHHILHNWSDTYCLEILKHLHAAMRPGYSRLLIHEQILPDTGASKWQAVYDVMMMAFNSGMERSRAQWDSLLRQAGFQIVEYWVEDEEADGIIEAVVRV